ncbi:MAG: hypothetical protein ABL977_00915 [Candidatus Eisenbacteria bacterium]
MRPAQRRVRRSAATLVLVAWFALSLGACQKQPSGVGSTSGGPPKLHDVLKSPDGQWELTVVDRDPADPDLIGRAWQVYLGPAGQPIDSAHCVFDAQELVPTASWRNADTIDVSVTGPKQRLADVPPDWRSFETVLGRDGQRHTFPLFVVTKPQ